MLFTEDSLPSPEVALVLGVGHARASVFVPREAIHRSFLPAAMAHSKLQLSMVHLGWTCGLPLFVCPLAYEFWREGPLDCILV